jgi:hypothetical protein
MRQANPVPDVQDEVSDGSARTEVPMTQPSRSSGLSEFSPLQGPQASLSPGSQAPATEDALGALKSIAEVGGVFVGLCFVGGWSFMASYYLSFGVNSSDLDFSVPATSAFAVHMLRNSGWPLSLAAVLLLCLALFSGRLGPWRRIWAGALIVILMFAVATAGTLRGRTVAEEDVLDSSSRLPNVGFATKTRLQDPAGEPYYFFEPVPSAASPSRHGRNLRIYVVPEAEISVVQLVRGLE